VVAVVVGVLVVVVRGVDAIISYYYDTDNTSLLHIHIKLYIYIYIYIYNACRLKKLIITLPIVK
jgi:hypothetical protein